PPTAVSGWPHPPVPSHTNDACCVSWLQKEMPHAVLAPGKLHERLPLHVPLHCVGSGALPPSGERKPPSMGMGLPPSSLPSVCEGSGLDAHSLSGSTPAAIGVHTPPV